MNTGIRNERGSVSSVPYYMLGLSIGVLLGNSFHVDDYSKEELQMAQMQNQQIAVQLAGDENIRDISKLLIDPKEKTLSFIAKDAQGVREACEGSYEARHSTVHISGHLVCKQIVETN